MTKATETHRLEMGEAGCSVVKLTCDSPEEIKAAIDVPPGLNRRNRRLTQRWLAGIFRRLDSDKRGLRIVATCNGRVVSVGSEYQGKILILS